MDLEMQGRVAAITGGSMGIGKATAFNMSREGAKVAICARNKERLEAAAREISELTGNEVLPVVADMSNKDDADNFIEATVRHFGHLDIVVNCAGASPGGQFQTLKDDQWMMGLNLKFMGYVRTARAALPHLQARGWGRIVNVIGNDGVKPTFNEICPGACNAAGINFTMSLAEQLAPQGITVNCVNPGPVDTQRWDGLEAGIAAREGLTAAEARALTNKSMPMGRIARADEVADMVTFLASERASFVTGASIALDGAQRKAIINPL